ncbi:phosphoribosylformylglycinamidine synthase [Mycoplasma sp. P36-A1]|uniref:phosphoribosylformylglycinamidine synthase n=1 Tax=Mycoplasma sp. P36-A1 TaxID=3252900 RepID=UPI003C2EF856
MNTRIYVEKKTQFQTTQTNLFNQLKKDLKITSLNNLRMIQVYDVLNVDETSLAKAEKTLFMEIATDNLFHDLDLSNLNYFAIEALAGQFDQRASSARSGLLLLGANNEVDVKSSIIYILNNEVSIEEKQNIIKFLVNPLENQVKDLSLPLDNNIDINIKPVETVDGFISMNVKDLELFLNEQNLAMNIEDLKFIQNYFKIKNRDPRITEVLILDTYWSDHCRHTTFETELKNIDYSQSSINDEIDSAYKTYIKMKTELNRSDKPMTLMEMASIEARYERANGMLLDMEVSDEVNACSIEIDVDVDGTDEKYLLMYKNETHNHPTEIEPFGGAATCVGGAIRDPLSGRSYVFQGMRVTGAGNVLAPIEQTLPGKLSQRAITQNAAKGYSSYGNQIGLCTTFIKELYHPGYLAKRMELGAVVGAAPKSMVVRKQPEVGDIVVLLGGATGRDGVGGATGSSKVQHKETLVEAKSEVQKGNAPEERKLQRLFRNEEVSKMIKKANDFGAGGVSVAIGEIADGVDINLDVLPTKYDGLNGTDLALSESQERMAVVIEAKDFDRFKQLANEENTVAVNVATVTAAKKMIMRWQNNIIVDIDREFLDTNGIRQSINPTILDTNVDTVFKSEFVTSKLETSLKTMLQDLRYASTKSLSSIFDNNVGRSTVLAAYGGKYQLSPAEVSAQKIPVEKGFTNTVSVLAYGGNPEIGEYQPFYVGSYAIIESVARIVASGGKWNNVRLSLQEYFERVSNDGERFGKPVAALLGALQTQRKLNLPALGGKDSMSGTYNEIDVPPTVISFAITTAKAKDILSVEFKETNQYVYALKTTRSEKIDYEILKENFNLMNQLQTDNKITSAISIKNGGMLKAIYDSSIGNNIGIKLEKISIDELLYPYYGGFVFASNTKLDNDQLIYLGTTIQDSIEYQNEVIDLKELVTINEEVLADIYPTTYAHKLSNEPKEIENYKLGKLNKLEYSATAIENPIAYIPVFYGTNSEYDVAKGLTKAGCKINMLPFVDLNEEQINKSIDKMVEALDNSNIFAISGGFSAGDEPDGSGKYIVNILLNEKVSAAIERFIAREGLIIGICNGFQALIKSGLLPYGKIGQLSENMPTLFLNERGNHISSFIKTKSHNNNSPWLSKIKEDDINTIAISHGEGRFMADDITIKELFENGQVITQYVDLENKPSMDYRFNPNGSFAAIEGITSLDGRILGKMGHTERYEDGLYQNIIGEKEQQLFEGAVAYFRKIK